LEARRCCVGWGCGGRCDGSAYAGACCFRPEATSRCRICVASGVVGGRWIAGGSRVVILGRYIFTIDAIRCVEPEIPAIGPDRGIPGIKFRKGDGVVCFDCRAATGGGIIVSHPGIAFAGAVGGGVGGGVCVVVLGRQILGIDTIRCVEPEIPAVRPDGRVPGIKLRKGDSVVCFDCRAATDCGIIVSHPGIAFVGAVGGGVGGGVFVAAGAGCGGCGK